MGLLACVAAMKGPFSRVLEGMVYRDVPGAT